MNRPIVQVVAGVIRNGDGKVLLTRRMPGTHLAGLWEFPGGKSHSGETELDALKRELREELHIEVESALPQISVQHDYSEKTVRLCVWEVTAYRGEPVGAEGQQLQWIYPQQIDAARMPAADKPVLTSLLLPQQYLITPEPRGDRDAYLRTLEHALAGPIRIIQFRAHTLDASRYRDWAVAVVEVCHRFNAKVLLNRTPAVVEETGADGVHLTGELLRSLAARPLEGRYLVSASCHSEAEIELARNIDVDFAVLSPVQVTTSHPEAIPMGWELFARYCNRANFPIYALGGMQQGDIEIARQFGGQGVAAIRAFWPEVGLT